jgi:hypothetical protein
MQGKGKANGKGSMEMGEEEGTFVSTENGRGREKCKMLTGHYLTDEIEIDFKE